MSAMPSTLPATDTGLLTVSHVVYALHAASLIAAVIGGATLVGALLFIAPSMIALIVNYLLREQVQDAMIASHFRWQMRGCWIALGAMLGISVLSFAIATMHVAGFALWMGGMLGVGAWVAYRIARGWIALARGRAVGA